jgi:malate dehydrogenase (oxaloacetate-decarboxylating)(NADP+)
MQADTALVPSISAESFPFNRVPGDANVLVFPDLQSANIAYKLMWRMGSVDAIGPYLVGMNKPVCVLQRGSEVMDIVNMASLTVLDVVKKGLKEN